ncbi:helix-turn-helix transcriptional regulator [Frankia sp. CNm7]|uniref:Helix-turn-helix transcriptional regulator n=2 Tax=Frankia nepalensis TaxID=1836974 RepID=A0A937RTV2_9ACTN|nr:helix-turn-helix transcriptional regulator [Frankia nepalensis]MBL7512089.1 helix-turn-helix transcriptional regulator [Frankia nepalensis]MBL7523255.1 helix-turn-helix transcriptional regulator [Frankia nepalensis]MBL7631811.1 helix-turn-helix transcriptional regulator [Frankia nepalensis]
MRRSVGVSAGTVEHRATEPISYWHRHDLHEIEYAVDGLAEIYTPTTHYLLPPRHAAWIPAGVEHSPLLRDVTTIAVFFDPAEFAFPRTRTTIISVPPVLREMMRYAARWPIWRNADESDAAGEGTGDGAEANAFFHALAGVVRRQLAHEAPLSLPVSDDPVVRDVIAYTAAHLVDADAASVCRAVGISERALRRRFAAALGQTWRDHLRQARLFRAMAMLSTSTMSVGEIAVEVGFGSGSALARAFRTWTGESPSEYRERWLTPDAPVGSPPSAGTGDEFAAARADAHADRRIRHRSASRSWSSQPARSF